MSPGPGHLPPATRSRPLRAWLELARVSNLPTVLSNAIAGATLGACALGIERSFDSGLLVWAGGIVAPDGIASAESHPFRGLGGAARFLAPFAIPILAYVGGMILNDAFDAEVDARERPSRPIPSGRVSRRAAFAAGFGLLAGALALALAGSAGATSVALATGVLCAAIVVYDRFHLASTASTLLLALCRALASFIPMLAFADGEIEVLVRRGAIALPIALAAWTLGLSLLARSEVALRGDLATRTAGRDAPEPCPACGHLMLGDPNRDPDRDPNREVAACGECGQTSSERERRIAAGYVRRRHGRVIDLAPVVAVIAMLLGFGLVHHALLHRGRDEGGLLVDGMPFAGLACAALLVLFTLRARRAMRNDPRRTPEAIGTLIACLALVDAMALATGGLWLPAVACAALFVLTRAFQRKIAGS